MTDDSRLDTDALHSWKEIAAHLGRDVRTAIRWERDRGLPVHRVPGGQRGAIFAYRSEIDAWLRGRDTDEDRARTIAGRTTRDPDAAVAPALAVDAARTFREPGSAAPSGQLRRLWPRLSLVTGAAAIILSLTAGAFLVRRPGSASVRRPAVAKLDFGPRELIARAEDGGVVWRYPISQGVQAYVLTGVAGVTSPWYAVADLDGDGRPEVVASVPLHPAAQGQAATTDVAEDELFCFSADGEVLWRTRFEDRLTFRAGAFDPPWLVGHVAVFHAKGGLRIAWSLLHHTWWPSALLLLDGKGTRLSTFVHAGSIRALRATEFGGRPLLLAGGVSNAYRAAFLAIIDGEDVSGHGPMASGSPFECLGCAERLPLRYFLFPPSDINSASALPYNTLRDVRSLGREFEAFTLESGAAPAPLAEMSFRFSPTLDLIDARSSDSWMAHEALEQAGKLDHGVAQCPWYLKPPPVREWDAEHGWRDVSAPRAAQPLTAPAR